jgi:hypothetical protein
MKRQKADRLNTKEFLLLKLSHIWPMRIAMLWLYLLGAVTVLIIVLRRVVRRLKPLREELHSAQIAIDYGQSGAAWVRPDGRVGSVNQCLADSLGRSPKKLVGIPWVELFAPSERDRATKAYSQMLLTGTERLETFGLRPEATTVVLQVLLVAVYDHRMRFVGHHCLTQDCTRVRALEEQLRVAHQVPVTVG